MAKQTVRRVRVFKLPATAWENPVPLEQLINATLNMKERIVGVVPGPKMTALILITEEP